MSRFDDIDLARLPALPLGQDTYEALRQARIGELVARLEANSFSYDVGDLETDPLVVANAEAGAARELLALVRRDDGVRAVFLATSWGPFLDQVGASQVPPVLRKILVAADPQTGTAAIIEGDDDFRRRIQLAPEALSTCGPEGAYLFYAMAVAGVSTAGAYGPMSFGGTPANPFTPLGEVHVPILAAAGNGAASADLVATVQGQLSPDDRRPIGDFVTVSAATVVPYTIVANLRVGPGADPAIVQAQALARLTRQALRQRRPGAAALRQQFYGAAYVADATGAIVVEEVDLIQPADDVNAGPISPASPAAAYRAPVCTGVTITLEIVDD